MTRTCAFAREAAFSLDEAVSRGSEALGNEGFGVSTGIAGIATEVRAGLEHVPAAL